MISFFVAAFLLLMTENAFGLGGPVVMNWIRFSGLEHANLPITGGKVTIECIFALSLHPGESFWIDRVNEPWPVFECVVDQKSVNVVPQHCYVQLELDELPFGRYQCAWGDIEDRTSQRTRRSAEVFRYNYRLCDSETACSKCNPTHPWCRIVPDRDSENGTKAECFTSWDTDYDCPKSDSLRCPSVSDANDTNSCDGFANGESVWAVYSGVDKCPEDSAALYISYDGKTTPFDQPFLIRGEVPTLKVMLPSDIAGSPLNNASVKISDSSAVIAQSPLRSRDNTIQLEALFSGNGSRTYELVGDAYYSDIRVRLKNTLVIIDTELEVRFADDLISTHCELNHEISDLDPSFKHVIWYSVGNETKSRSAHKFRNANETASAFCHVLVTYKRCQPFVDLKVYSNYSLADGLRKVVPDEESKSPALKPKEPEQGIKDEKQSAESWTPAEIGFLVGGVSLGFLIGGGIVLGVFYVNWKQNRKRGSRNKELEATYKEEQNVLELGEIRETARDVVGSEELASKFISSVDDPSVKTREAATDKLETVPNCRHSEIPLRSSTKIMFGKKGNRGLHMTKMKDYYSRPVLLAQGPLKEQFERHLRAVWNERVGTVVIGSEEQEGKESTWEEFFSAHDDCSVRCGRFTTYNAGTLKKKDEYDQFFVDVSLKKGKRALKRRLWIVRVSASATPSKLVEVVETARDWQERQVNENLPGVLFQCPTGIHLSAVLLTSFIGSQMWSQRSSMNMLGLLRYVRRHRYGVFSIDGGVPDLRTTMSMMQLVASVADMGNYGPWHVEDHERDVFDVALRKKELDEYREVEREEKRTKTLLPV